MLIDLIKWNTKLTVRSLMKTGRFEQPPTERPTHGTIDHPYWIIVLVFKFVAFYHWTYKKAKYLKLEMHMGEAV